MVLTKGVKVNQLARASILVLGEFSIFLSRVMESTRFLWKRRSHFIQQCEFIGVSSLGITLAAALFMGAVLGYQLYTSLHRFGAEALIGGTVGVSLMRELAPVMAAIMVTGRAGAAMAALLSSMRITEQIDALEVMAIDPVEYLVTPRVWAGLAMMPLLATAFTLVASMSAAFVSCGVMGLQYGVFWSQFWLRTDPIDLAHLLVKASAFGFLLSVIGCFCGFRARGGAAAVGTATRTTVVASFLVILFCDYFLTSVLPLGFKKLEVM